MMEYNETVMKEIWKDIKGYEGLYQVSNFGRIKSVPRFRNNQFGNFEMILKQNLQKGYMKISLIKDGVRKCFNVHRLVAEAFIPNQNNYPCVNHKDENKINNVVTNLEWCNHKHNANWGTRNDRMLKARNKTSERWAEKVVEQYTKDGEFVAEYKSVNEAGRYTGVSVMGISEVCRGKEKVDKDGYIYKRKTAGGYVWRFKEMEEVNMTSELDPMEYNSMELCGTTETNL